MILLAVSIITLRLGIIFPAEAQVLRCVLRSPIYIISLSRNN